MQNLHFTGQRLTSLLLGCKTPTNSLTRSFFFCDIYPIPPKYKKLDNIKQEGSFMGYTNSRVTIKFWGPNTKKLKYYSSEKYY